METKLAIATVADSRPDFFAKREGLVHEELETIEWLRKSYQVIESDILFGDLQVKAFARQAISFGAQSLILHIPVWADPIFAIKLTNYLPLPILLMGNSRPETSSTVGLLGAGGALDQVGRSHERIYDHRNPVLRRKVDAFVRAATARSLLRGQKLVLFGGPSLGIFTAIADPAQWQSLFGVELCQAEQLELVTTAQEIPDIEVKKHTNWLTSSLGDVKFGDNFDQSALEKQVRSYLATRQLISKYGADFVGVKCQPELSDGYVTQCVSHMLTNGMVDADGSKQAVVHACESDADGALTMQILHLLSAGSPTALMDIRLFNPQQGTWLLANCGALAASFYANERDASGLSCICMMPHVFGKGGGGALPAVVTPQPVTLARLCRKNGEYWMAILKGTVQPFSRDEMTNTTSVFPQALVKSSAAADFLDQFGSNHIHMVTGNVAEELTAFCRLAGIRWQLWD